MSCRKRDNDGTSTEHRIVKIPNRSGTYCISQSKSAEGSCNITLIDGMGNRQIRR